MRHIIDNPPKEVKAMQNLTEAARVARSSG